MRFSIIFSLVILVAACGDDGGTTDTGTATDSATDTGTATDSATDTGTATDSATDTGTPGDAGPCDTCIAAELTWGDIGGKAIYTRESKISTCRDYALTQVETFGDPPETLMCGNEVPCGVTDAVTIEDVNAALAHADVVAAFGAAPILYGEDDRPADGTIFVFTQSGAAVSVGAPCRSGSGCVAIPEGVAALVTQLRGLDTERLAEPDCSTVFP